MNDGRVVQTGSVTSVRTVTGNAILNLAGQLAPAGAAVVALPILARGFGDERLGLLAVVWAAVGFFSLLDLGLGRALTQTLAARLAVGAADSLSAVVWTAWAALGALGLVAGGLVIVARPWLAHVLFNAPPALGGEVEQCLLLLGLSVPLVTCASGPRGLLEAHQRFDLVNLVRVPLGASMYAGPVLVLPFTHSIAAAAGVIVVSRAAALAAFTALALRQMPGLRMPRLAAWRDLGGFAAMSGWMTLANVAGSTLVYVDRAVVAAVLPMAALAYYAAPQELVTKLAAVPVAFSTTIFPAFSAESSTRSTRLAALFFQGLRYIFLALFPLTLLAATFAPEWLGLWLGPAYAVQSVQVVRWCTVGILFNGLAMVPFALLQASGHARSTAVLQIVEVPFYLGTLWWLVSRFGIAGAAAGWTVRVSVDAVVLAVLAVWRLGGPVVPSRPVAVLGFVALGSFAVVGWAGSLALRAAVCGAALVVVAALAVRVMAPGERAAVAGWWFRRR